MRKGIFAIAKNELRQYLSSHADGLLLFILALLAFLTLLTPEFQQSALPSSYGIYSVGYLRGSQASKADSYSLRLVPFEDRYEMMYASNMGYIDAFIIDGRDGMAVFSSGGKKSEAALTRIDQALSSLNSRLMMEKAFSDESLYGVFLPLRIDVVRQKIDYDAVLNGSMQAGRNLLKSQKKDISVGTQKVEKSTDFSQKSPGKDYFGDFSDAKTPSSGQASYAGLSLPSDLEAEFPFKSLYRNMTFITPLLMLSILVCLSLSKERIDRSIENLFMTPLTNFEILSGKALPYAFFMLIICGIYGFWVGGLKTCSIKVFLVFAAVSASMLSFSLFSFVVSRSYRELTLIGSFSLFVFFFFIVLPNVFSGVNVLSFISPLNTVTSIENGAFISFSDIFLSLLPYAFMCAFFTSFACTCFNSEILSQDKSFFGLLPHFYESLQRSSQDKHLYVMLSVSLLVPFIFIVENIMAYLVLPMGSLAPLLSLVLFAMAEEAVKIIPYYYIRMNPLKYGAISGMSFFICEKVFNLYLVVKVYSYLGGPYAYFLRAMAPTLALHMLTTAVFAAIIWKNKGPNRLFIGLLASSWLHVSYNLMVLGGVI